MLGKASGAIHVRVYTSFGTNDVHGLPARAFADSLARSNRISMRIFHRLQDLAGYDVMKDTNILFGVQRYDGGILNVGDYYFRLKTVPKQLP
jgi:hypothetical protein